MRTLPAIGACCLLVVASVIVLRLLPEDEPRVSASAELEAQVAGLREEVAVLKRGQAELRAELQAARDRPRIARDSRSAIHGRPPSSRPEERDTSAGDGSAGDRAPEVADHLESLAAPGLGEAEEVDLWEAMRSSGALSEAIALLEGRVARNPGDPEARSLLGRACIQKIQTGVSGAEAERLAAQADEAFSEALKIDPFHWRARYEKAAALTYWPDTAGRQGEAIAHFEILVEQQDGLVGDPRFARTHLLLGDAYAKQGQHEAAYASWEKGLQSFPDDPGLKWKIDQARSK